MSEQSRQLSDRMVELAELARSLGEIRTRIRELAGEDLDAIIDPDGQSWLLPKAQGELYRSEADQRAAAELNRAILDSLPAEVAMLDGNGVITSVNGRWREFGRSHGMSDPQYGIGQNYLEICRQGGVSVGQDTEPVASAIEEALNGIDSGFSMEYPCHSPEREQWFRMLVSPLPGPDGGAVVMHIDISDRMLAERAARSSERRFQGIFATIGVGVVVSDAAGRLQEVNPGFTRMMVGSTESLSGMVVDDLVHPDDLQAHKQLMSQVLGGDVEDPVRELRMVRRDNRVIRVRIRMNRLAVEQGNGHLLIMIIEDVTRERELEEQLRRAHRLEAVGQLTGGIAHDFNNLLTVVIGSAEILVEQEGPDQRLGELILSAAERGAELTRRLLAFARRQTLQPVVLDVDQLITDLVPLLRNSVGESVELVFEQDCGRHMIEVDPAQLESSLLNLCLNARDAMPGGGRLVIRTKVTMMDEPEEADVEPLQAGQYVEIQVMDQGEGIAPEHLGRVFEPFFSTKEVGRGTGLGLSMVYGFARQSGGTARIESEPGEGTCVRLLLPVH